MGAADRKGQGVGASVLRKEDDRFLRGRGCYVGDIELPGLREVAFLRSPLAHARILAIRKPSGAEASVFVRADLDIRSVQAKLGLPGFKSAACSPGVAWMPQNKLSPVLSARKASRRSTWVISSAVSASISRS